MTSHYESSRLAFWVPPFAGSEPLILHASFEENLIESLSNMFFI